MATDSSGGLSGKVKMSDVDDASDASSKRGKTLLGEGKDSTDDYIYPQMEFYAGSKKGAKPWQEDSFFVFASPRNKVFVGGVLDGHGGYNGWVASSTARDYAFAFFEKNKHECEKWSVEEWKKQMQALFSLLHAGIRDKFVKDTSEDSLKNGRRFVDDKGIVRSSSTGDPVHGGTTASFVATVRHADGSVTVITTNVGDSTCLITPRAGGSYQFLTVDHGPESKEEYMRVKQLDTAAYPHKLLYVYDKTSVFRKYECPLVFLDDGNKDPTFVTNPWGNGLHPTNVRYEPAVYAVTPRVITKDSTCIAMTRALGDFYAHQFGLTCEPSIGVKHFSASTLAENGGSGWTIFVASDGVWDCWKFEEFTLATNKLLTARAGRLDEVGVSVLEESVAKATANFGARNIDDAALILFPLLMPGTVRVSSGGGDGGGGAGAANSSSSSSSSSSSTSGISITSSSSTASLTAVSSSSSASLSDASSAAVNKSTRSPSDAVAAGALSSSSNAKKEDDDGRMTDDNPT